MFVDGFNNFSESLVVLTKKTDVSAELLNGTIANLGENLNSSAVLINNEGKVLVYHVNESDFKITTFMSGEDLFIESALNEQLKNNLNIKSNLLLSQLFIKITPKDKALKYNCAILPLISVSQRLGSLFIYRQTGPYSCGEMAVAKCALSFSIIIAKRIYNEENIENYLSDGIIKGAIDTLSYSELKAVYNIFSELEGAQGLVVASKTADRVGITRSVIVNGLRKLESAGLIESRSLGMKGTYIKILNCKLADEINKFKHYYE